MFILRNRCRSYALNWNFGPALRCCSSSKSPGSSDEPPTRSKRKPDFRRERAVPSSRMGRIATFGGLAADVGFAGAKSFVKSALAGESKSYKESLASPEVMAKLVSGLCRARGAALKLGQMLSLQDDVLLPPHLREIWERVRDSADIMPWSQTEQVLIKELGPDWRSKYASFDEKPMAAASIGQVHGATLPDGTKLAVKVQYPGVDESIVSDIDNLMSFANHLDMLPRGLFIENTTRVLKQELTLETDYLRESSLMSRYCDFLVDEKFLKVPRVFHDLCTKRVLTAELVDGFSVDQVTDQADRQIVCEELMHLTLKELFLFDLMQTDPNWSNFLFDPDTKTISVLDFGACRAFGHAFTDDYMRVLIAAARNERQTVADLSIKLGFLTPFEAKPMIDAHVEAVCVLGEAFRVEKFNFGDPETTKRIHRLMPIMLRHRLKPPPDESYSLHRKLAGVFLLCSRLNVQMDCASFFRSITKQYTFRDTGSSAYDLLNRPE